jgi:hypothetical protein
MQDSSGMIGDYSSMVSDCIVFGSQWGLYSLGCFSFLDSLMMMLLAIIICHGNKTTTALRSPSFAFDRAIERAEHFEFESN